MSAGEKIQYSTGATFGGGLAGDAVNQIGTGAVALHQIGGFSPSTEPADYYVMLFDDAAVNPGDTPFQCFAVPIGGSFSWEPSLEGHVCSLSLKYALSSTPGVYTATVGASLWLYAEAIDQEP